MVRLLLERGAAVGHAANNGRTSLHFATYQGHEPVVRLLLERGAAVNHADKNGYTSIFIASQQGHEPVARLLLERGAAVDHAANTGRTSLHIASQQGHEPVVRLLARAGADLDHRLNAGNTPEDLARAAEKVAIADWLAASRGFTALHFACDARDHAGALALLRGEGVRDVGALSAGGRSALQVALLADAPMALPLCEETAALMRAAASPWSNHTHWVWPESFRARGVLTVLCVAKFGEGWAALPKDLLLHALGFCGRDWFLVAGELEAAADGTR